MLLSKKLVVLLMSVVMSSLYLGACSDDDDDDDNLPPLPEEFRATWSTGCLDDSADEEEELSKAAMTLLLTIDGKGTSMTITSTRYSYTGEEAVCEDENKLTKSETTFSVGVVKDHKGAKVVKSTTKSFKITLYDEELVNDFNSDPQKGLGKVWGLGEATDITSSIPSSKKSGTFLMRVVGNQLLHGGYNEKLGDNNPELTVESADPDEIFNKVN